MKTLNPNRPIPLPYRVSLVCGILSLVVASLGVVLDAPIIVGLGGACMASGLTAVLYGLVVDEP